MTAWRCDELVSASHQKWIARRESGAGGIVRNSVQFETAHLLSRKQYLNVRSWPGHSKNMQLAKLFTSGHRTMRIIGQKERCYLQNIREAATGENDPFGSTLWGADC